MAAYTPQPSVDDVFTALSNAKRRELLDSLIADSPPDDPANAGIEVDLDSAMYHTHLPKLAAYGLINWDRNAGRVTKGPHFEAAASLLLFLEQSSAAPSFEEDSV